MAGNIMKGSRTVDNATIFNELDSTWSWEKLEKMFSLISVFNLALSEWQHAIADCLNVNFSGNELSIRWIPKVEAISLTKMIP
jgi:hypothetical protein